VRIRHLRMLAAEIRASKGSAGSAMGHRDRMCVGEGKRGTLMCVIIGGVLQFAKSTTFEEKIHVCNT
jgi:hypothetical protein